MSRLTRREFVAGVSALACVGDAAAQENGGLVLWFKKPAAQWTDALPIGNGRLGAMVFGGAKEERLQLNEDTLWSGAPRQWNNPEALQHLPEVRSLVLEQQDYVAADKVTRKCRDRSLRRISRSATCTSRWTTRRMWPTTAAISISTRPSHAPSIGSARRNTSAKLSSRRWTR